MTRVMRRANTKTKAVRLVRSKNGAQVAVKSRYTHHSNTCGCAICKKRRARRLKFPQDV